MAFKVSTGLFMGCVTGWVTMKLAGIETPVADQLLIAVAGAWVSLMAYHRKIKPASKTRWVTPEEFAEKLSAFKNTSAKLVVHEPEQTTWCSSCDEIRPVRTMAWDSDGDEYRCMNCWKLPETLGAIGYIQHWVLNHRPLVGGFKPQRLPVILPNAEGLLVDADGMTYTNIMWRHVNG